jgi:hypothetical protein
MIWLVRRLVHNRGFILQGAKDHDGREEAAGIRTISLPASLAVGIFQAAVTPLARDVIDVAVYPSS